MGCYCTTRPYHFECDGVPEQVAKEAFELAAQKLPILTKFVVRHDYSVRKIK